MPNKKDIFDASRDVSNILKFFDPTKRQKVINLALTSLNEINSDTGAFLSQPNFQTHYKDPVQHENGAGQEQTKPAINIKSFIEQKNPTSDIHLVTTIAYYYAFEAPEGKRKESVGAEDLKKALRQLQEKKFIKPVHVLNNAKNRGLLDSVEQGQFKINSVGENLVAMVLPDKHSKILYSTTPKKKTKQRKTKKRSRKQ